MNKLILKDIQWRMQNRIILLHQAPFWCLMKLQHQVNYGFVFTAYFLMRLLRKIQYVTSGSDTFLCICQERQPPEWSFRNRQLTTEEHLNKHTVTKTWKPQNFCYLLTVSSIGLLLNMLWPVRKPIELCKYSWVHSNKL